MANTLLLNWLNGKRNYTVGEVLYRQFGNDDAIKKQLATGKSDYTEKLLLDHITKLLDGEEHKEPEKFISTFEPMPEDKEPVLQSLRNKWLPLYTEMNYKRHTLDRLLDEVDEKAAMIRGGLARDILLLEKQCMAIWQERDYYVKHKTLPGKSIEAERVIDPYHAANRAQNLKIYIRRYKHALAKDPGDAKAAQLLNQYTEELTELQNAHG